MNNGELSPSFFDAVDGSPDQPTSNNNTPAAVNAGITPVSENTPIGARILFPEEPAPPDDAFNEHMAYLRWLERQNVNLDLGLIRQDENDEGEGDSTCDANELEILDLSKEEAEEDRLKTIVKNAWC